MTSLARTMATAATMGSPDMPQTGPTPIPGHQFLRRGPAPEGWARSAEFLYVCAHCGDQMPGNQDDYFHCRCGDMYLDVDAFRFGSRNGDMAVLVYRKVKGRE